MDKTQHTITKFGITLTVSLSSDIVDGENFGPKVEWVSSSIDELIEDISSHPPSDSCPTVGETHMQGLIIESFYPAFHELTRFSELIQMSDEYND